jgi:hypothetical protein
MEDDERENELEDDELEEREEEDEKTKLSDKFDDRTAKALGKFVKKVLDDRSKWQELHDDPIGTAERAGVEITETTRKVVVMLGETGDDELELVRKLNDTLVDGHVYAETGNPPLCVF